jgi:hypothetical protein
MKTKRESQSKLPVGSLRGDLPFAHEASPSESL